MCPASLQGEQDSVALAQCRMHNGGFYSSWIVYVLQEQHEMLKEELALSRGREAEQRLQHAEAVPQRAAEESDTKLQPSLQPQTPSRRGGSFASTSGASSRGPSRRSSTAAPQPQRLSPDALAAALTAALAARARAPDLAAVREAAVMRRRNLQRQLTSISTVHTLKSCINAHGCGTCGGICMSDNT